MPTDVPGPTLRQTQALATRQRLLEVATTLFCDQGFSSVTTTDLCTAAGVTRGALYHHFANMTEVMESVFRDIEGQLVDRVVAELSSVEPARAQLTALGSVVLNALVADDRITRIVFVEAPSALGWSRWRSLDGGRSRTLIADVLRRCNDAGDLRDGIDPSLTAQLLLGAINEAGMYVGAHHTSHAPIVHQLTLLTEGILRQ
ncbi:MAG: TetR/AcrR family transcriptional regulator [Gordonia amarae]